MGSETKSRTFSLIQIGVNSIPPRFIGSTDNCPRPHNAPVTADHAFSEAAQSRGFVTVVMTTRCQRLMPQSDQETVMHIFRKYWLGLLENNHEIKAQILACHTSICKTVTRLDHHEKLQQEELWQGFRYVFTTVCEKGPNSRDESPTSEEVAWNPDYSQVCL